MEWMIKWNNIIRQALRNEDCYDLDLKWLKLDYFKIYITWENYSFHKSGKSLPVCLFAFDYRFNVTYVEILGLSKFIWICLPSMVLFKVSGLCD